MGNARRDPALTAAADQADAAAADMRGRVQAGFELARIMGRIEAAYSSEAPRTGPRARVIARAQAALEGEVIMCEHVAAVFAPALPPGLARVAASPIPAAVWMAWHPDTIACPLCARLLPRPDDTEDRRCDGCGRVTAPGEIMHAGSEVIAANPASASPGHPLAPPLVCAYGLCGRCAAKSGVTRGSTP